MITNANRKQILFWIFVGLLGWKFFLPIVNNPIDQKIQEIATIREGTSDLQSRVDRLVGYAKRIQSTGKLSLPEDLTLASIRYQEWLRTVCDKAGIESPAISFREASKVDGLGLKFQGSIRTKSRLVAIGDLLDILFNANVLHRIGSCKLHDWDGLENKLQLDIELEAFSIKDNPASNPNLFSQALETRELGRFLENRLSFSPYVAPRPKITEIAISLEQKGGDDLSQRPPKIDLLNLVRFVGTLEKDGVSKGLFWDTHLNQDRVVEVNTTILIETFVARLVRIEEDQAVFVNGTKEFIVKLGQTIRQGLGKSQAGMIQ